MIQYLQFQLMTMMAQECERWMENFQIINDLTLPDGYVAGEAENAMDNAEEVIGALGYAFKQVTEGYVSHIGQVNGMLEMFWISIPPMVPTLLKLSKAPHIIKEPMLVDMGGQIIFTGKHIEPDMLNREMDRE